MSRHEPKSGARRASEDTQQPDINAQRRRDLLDAAFSLIAEKGLEGLRTRDIAERAGISIAMLHYYFGTKDALIVAAVRHIREIFTTPLPGAPGTDQVPDLHSYFAAAWRRFEDNPNLAAVLQELMLRARRDTDARAALEEVQEFWTSLVETILRKAIAGGKVRADVDPRRSAFVVTSFIMGAAARLGMTPDLFDFQEVSRELAHWLKTADAHPEEPMAAGTNC